MLSSRSPYLVKEIILTSKYWFDFKSRIADEGTSFISRGFAHGILVIDLENNDERRIDCRGHAYAAVRYTPDGRKAIFKTYTGEIEIWSTGTREENSTGFVHKIEARDSSLSIMSMECTNEKVFLHANDNSICIYDIETGKLCATTEKSSDHHIWTIIPIGMSHIAAIFMYSLSGNAIMIYDVITGKITMARYFDFYVKSIHTTDIQHELVINTTNGQIYLWDFKKDVLSYWRSLTALPEAGKMKYIGTRKIAYSYDNFGCIMLYDLYSRDEKSVTIHTECIDGFDPIQFTGDGRYMQISDQYSVRIYSLDIFPRWSVEKHPTFKDDMGRCIRFLFLANRILWKRNKRKRLTFAEIPKEVMCHIFSFLRRES